MNFSWQQAAKPIVGMSGMDGITDAAMRHVTAKHGRPDVMLTEFTSVEGLTHHAVRLLRDLHYTPIQRPIIAQLYGATPEAFRTCALLVCALGFDGVDINMGCPSHAVTRHGCGAALIEAPELAKTIIAATRQGILDWCDGREIDNLRLKASFVESVKASPNYIGRRPQRSPIPVSVKTRTGYDRIKTSDWIACLLDTGLDNISLHGRTLEQRYTGQANWEEIAKAAALARGTCTTILGNGDLKNHQEIHQRIEQSGVDGVLIGRAAMGNPWIFKRNPANGSKDSKDARATTATPGDRVQVALEHVQYFEYLNQTIFKEDPFPFVNMRKHLGWYWRDVPHSRVWRDQLLRAVSAAQVEQILMALGEHFQEEVTARAGESDLRS